MSLVLDAGPLSELADLTGMTKIHLSVIALKQVTLFHNQLEIFFRGLTRVFRNCSGCPLGAKGADVFRLFFI